MINLLHITYDLRSRNAMPVTSAVGDLIKETEKIANVKIVDLLRVPNFKNEIVQKQNDNHILINSFGFPYGIFLISSLKRAYNKILQAAENGIIDLSSTKVIHAHKVTFGGYCAYHLAEKLNTKLIVTLRQTDAWIFKVRPDLIRNFKPILERSDKIIYLMPFINTLMVKYLGKEFFDRHVKNKLEFLPNIVERNLASDRKITIDDYYLTAIRMDRRSVKRKNLKRLFEAVTQIKDSEFKLVVIGDGNYLPNVKKWAFRLGIENNVTFKGNIPNSEIDKFFASSKALLMPSLSESFGMVYAESLLNGTPIMYSINSMGFDGMFENVGVGVHPRSVNSIVQGIENLMKNNAIYRKHITHLQQTGELRIFSADHVRNRYSEIINSLLK